jgi:hypothetical protein
VPRKIAAASPPKKIMQVKLVRAFPDAIPAKRLSLNKIKAVIHNPKKVITATKENALTMRTDQLCF